MSSLYNQTYGKVYGQTPGYGQYAGGLPSWMQGAYDVAQEYAPARDVPSWMRAALDVAENREEIAARGAEEAMAREEQRQQVEDYYTSAIEEGAAGRVNPYDQRISDYINQLQAQAQATPEFLERYRGLGDQTRAQNQQVIDQLLQQMNQGIDVANPYAERETQLLDMLLGAAQGGAPSAAEQMMARERDLNAAAASGMLQSAVGTSPGLAAMQAQRAQAEANQRALAETGIVRAQEQEAARAAYAQAIDQARAEDRLRQELGLTGMQNLYGSYSDIMGLGLEADRLGLQAEQLGLGSQLDYAALAQQALGGAAGQSLQQQAIDDALRQFGISGAMGMEQMRVGEEQAALDRELQRWLSEEYGAQQSQLSQQNWLQGLGTAGIGAAGTLIGLLAGIPFGPAGMAAGAGIGGGIGSAAGNVGSIALGAPSL